MKLRSFEAFGFKSFADKTELSFDNGITAIVGPNGSGKSNISDAIRWALGEQSAKYLRGGKMEDVIFSGTTKRRALGLAEVNLVFDNTDHRLNIDFDEVSLTRRLYRSGDSDYLINKKQVRLKDVIELMADTGLGKGSMSIIGQNKIDEILNSRPEERRTIFEEAAGIAKYRNRKKDSLRKLEETAQNLVRINDIKVEKESRVAPMKEAADKTIRFNELAARQRQVRLTQSVRKIDGVDTERQRLMGKKAEREAEFAEKQTIQATRESELESLRHSLDVLNEDFATFQGIIGEKQTALAQAEGELKLLREREGQSRNAILRLGDTNRKLRDQILLCTDELGVLAKEYDAAEASFTDLSGQLDQCQIEREDARQRLDAITNEQSNAQNAYFQSMQEILQQQTELDALEREQENSVKHRDGLKEIIDALETEVAQAESRGRESADDLARWEHDAERLQQEHAAATERLQAERNVVQNLENSKTGAERELTMTETRLSSLQHMQENYDGFGNGIKAVLKCNSPWRNNVVGVAAELIKVDEKYVTAIETALGDGAQNIVMRDAGTAKAAITFLKQQNAGRATFLPLDTVEARYLRDDEKRIVQMPGIFGTAFDLVRCETSAEPALKFLLGRVLVAENLDLALEAARAAKFRLRVVTLDGDVVNAGGSLTGGAKRHREGYLTREKEIAELQEQKSKLDRDILTWQEKLEEAEANALQAAKTETILRDEKEKASLRVKELQLETADLQRQVNEANSKLTAAIGERTEAANDYMSRRDKVRQLREALQTKKNEDQGANEALEDLKRQIAHENTNLTALDNKIVDLRSRKDAAANHKEITEQRMQDIDKRQTEYQNGIRDNEEEQKKLDQVAANSVEERIKLENQHEAMLLDLQVTSADKEKFLEQRGNLQGKCDEAELNADEARKQAALADSKVHQAEMELTRQTADYEHSLEQLQLEYNLTVEQARNSDLLSESDRELSRMDRQLTTEIVELGPVNPGAVEEYNTVKTEAEFYCKQYNDLLEAKERLETVIAEINTSMSSKFKVAFGQINGYFANCYSDLFGGGTALLKLTNPEDILESGIDIEAQPPGKKLQGLFLLSGGERALTVIALLFALLSYQPSPFCILDEIDAPLDDANINRFSNFLHNYAQKTQFIVITHRKGTMESADIMYGVTMEESGVSKLLSVKINETSNMKGIEA